MRQWNKTLLSIVVASVACASCASWLPRDPVVMEEGPANLKVLTEVPNALADGEGTSIGYSLTFSTQDQQLHGVPAEAPFLITRPNWAIARADLGAHVHTNETPVIEKPCFAEPIGIRNDETGEVVHEIVDYCFPDWQDESLAIENAFDDDGPFSWDTV